MNVSAFSNAVLIKILDRPSRFLIDWTERGLIEADIMPATGPGSRRRYSYQAVLRAALGLHLKEKYGMARHIIKPFLDRLSESNIFKKWEINDSRCLGILFYKGGYTWFIDPETLKQTVSRLPQQIGEEEKKGNTITDLVIVDLANIKNNIDKRIEALSTK